ncbi:MAG: hypothetical protein ABFE07_24400 [Armatimonadia bacterium]
MTKAERLQKRWLASRECGWCNAKCTASRCQAMYGEKCDIEKQRAIWLQSYRPRALLKGQERHD